MATSRTTRASQVTNKGKTVTRSNQKKEQQTKILSWRQKVETDAEDMMSGELFQTFKVTIRIALLSTVCKQKTLPGGQQQQS